MLRSSRRGSSEGESCMKPRSIRRHHERRIKKRTRGYYGGYATHNARALGKLAHARTPCSCWMCGNPRRFSGELTLQERRAEAVGAIEQETGDGVSS